MWGFIFFYMEDPTLIKWQVLLVDDNDSHVQYLHLKKNL